MVRRGSPEKQLRTTTETPDISSCQLSRAGSVGMRQSLARGRRQVTCKQATWGHLETSGDTWREVTTCEMLLFSSVMSPKQCIMLPQRMRIIALDEYFNEGL